MMQVAWPTEAPKSQNRGAPVKIQGGFCRAWLVLASENDL